jgi:quercetin dioxygenase-like cupin family protein
MKPEITSLPRFIWTPLQHRGCQRVEARGLLRLDDLALAMLRFQPGGTIHEHPADIDIDVICLEGWGMTSVGGVAAPLKAGERVHWPAGVPHRLWAEEAAMVTLMVEHIAPGDKRPTAISKTGG